MPLPTSLPNLDTFTTTVSNLWNSAKSYIGSPSSNVTQTSDKIDQPEQDRSSGKPKTYQHIDYKRLLVLATVSLFNATKNQTAISLGLVALFAESVNATYPTVVNPIPTQYAQPGQPFSYDIDLNQVFNDADGDIMTFGGITMADGSPLPSWLTAMPIKLWGRDDYANAAEDVDVVGGIAYIANAQFGLLIFNISNPNLKVFLSSIDTLGGAAGVAVQNDIAYVANFNSGLQLINVSNASNPTLLSNYYTSGLAWNVIVENGVAYVAVGDSGLQLINVSNASAPSLLGTYDTPGNARGVVVQNGIAYVADWDSGLLLINVSNVSNPTLLSNYDIFAYSVTVQNEVVYLTRGDFGELLLINVSNPSNLTLLASYDNTLGPTNHVVVQNAVAYLAIGRYGIQIINVSNASNPTLLSNVEIAGGDALGVTVQNEMVYVADSGLGLQLINVSNTNNPVLLGSVEIPSATNGIAVQNEIVYVADEDAGLLLINISNARTPTLLARVSSERYGRANDVVAQNDLVYIGDINYVLHFINISNTSNPLELNRYPMPGPAADIVVQNGIAYVASGGFGLQLINVSDINNPMLLSNYPCDAARVGIQNGVAYVSASYGGGLRLINVSNPRNLTLLSIIVTSSAFPDVAIQNQIVYVADNDLHIFNVSNLSNPILLGSVYTPGEANSVTVQNGMAYVVGFTSGLQFINVTNISNPTLLGSVDTPGYAQGIVLQNGTVYVADYGTGLQIIGLTHTRLISTLPLNANGSYYFKVHATNSNSEWISTDIELRIGTQPSVAPTTAFLSSSSAQTNAPSNSNIPLATLSSVTANPSSSSPSASTSQNSSPITFSIIATSEPITIESGISTIITTDILFFTGNVSPSQVVYTVQGNNSDIVITVNGVEATQFTQADVEGNFVELALQGVTCGDYSTDLQLEANVAGSNAPAQQVSISLIFEGTTCTDAGRLSAFSFRDAQIGFWAQKQEIEQKGQPVQSHDHMSTFRY